MKIAPLAVCGLMSVSVLLTQSACAGSTVGAAGGAENPSVLIVGGGSSHDFPTWFQRADSATLAGAGASVSYTAAPAEVAARLAAADVLYQTANQPLADPALREAVFRHVAAGKGLIIGHAGTWYNWRDWPEYNRTLVSGGARAHRRYGEFTVNVTEPSHPVMRGVPATFTLQDELYRFLPDSAGPEIRVLATAREEETGQVYPIVWTVANTGGRILVNTLGHDAASHEHPAYQRILQNALRWVNGGN
jgi:type 1 glutamine amidotransferase